MVLRKSYLDKIIPFIDQDLIKVLVGIRRCGKTVLLGQIKDVLLQRNIPAQNIIQANFESMRFRNTRTAETLYDYIAEKAEGCTGICEWQDNIMYKCLHLLYRNREFALQWRI